MSEQNNDKNEMKKWDVAHRELNPFVLFIFKSLFIVNGGAIVALLALLGQIAGKVDPLPDVSCALLAFTSGLGFTLASALCGYLFLLCEFFPNYKKIIGKHSFIFQIIAIIFGIVAFAAFWTGSCKAINSFNSLKPSQFSHVARDQ